MTAKEKLEGRIYPAIKSCVGNRYKIITGIFSVYAFVKSSLNTNIITEKVSLYAAWVFTFFVVHNSANYFFNAWEQYGLEETEGNEISTGKRIWYFMRAEGFFLIAMLLIIWMGYFFVIK
ncbi:MAG: hypothetical protein QMD44_07495 [Thermodesulfovibrionales bacterium]|jgi:hypothetical protein|nr:hypothetical protein [Thermodesulfovibrionales bacterium]